MKKVPVKLLVLLLSIILLFPDNSFTSESVLKSFYKNAISAYSRGNYEEAIFHSRSCLELVPKSMILFKSKIYLLLAATYSKLDLRIESRKMLNVLKNFIDSHAKKQIPLIEFNNSKGQKSTIKINEIFGYKEVFKGKNYPIRNIIEIKGKKKSLHKKRLILTITAAIILGIISAILIFKKKSNKNDEIDNYRDIEWINIPAGEFEMGDDKGIGETNERPLHKVYLDEYSISKYEITYEQYDRFCDETGKNKPSNEIYGKKFIGRGKFPVVNITINDAIEFCQWLSKKLGKNVHLPTEAQWEKAARGTDKRTYPWGNQPPDSSIVNWSNSSYSKPKEVGSYPSGISPYGIYDMAGNVWEYCLDWYDANYYSRSPYKNPKGPLNGYFQIIRGGSFDRNDGPVRTTFRSANPGEIKYGHIGFRPVIEN